MECSRLFVSGIAFLTHKRAQATVPEPKKTTVQQFREDPDPGKQISRRGDTAYIQPGLQTFTPHSKERVKPNGISSKVASKISCQKRGVSFRCSCFLTGIIILFSINSHIIREIGYI